MTMVKKAAKAKSKKAPSSPEGLRKSERGPQPAGASRKTRSVSARVTPAQHREIKTFASVSGETTQTLLLRLLRDAGVKSITDADLLDERWGEGRAQRKPKRASATSGGNQLDLQSVRDQLDQILGLSGAQRFATGGLTLVINNYLRPEPSS